MRIKNNYGVYAERFYRIAYYYDEFGFYKKADEARKTAEQCEKKSRFYSGVTAPILKALEYMFVGEDMMEIEDRYDKMVIDLLKNEFPMAIKMARNEL